MSEEKQKELNIVKDFIHFLKGMRERKSITLNKGDKVLIVDKAFVSYLIPKGTTKTIGQNYERPKGPLYNYFTTTPGEVVGKEDLKYNCGHCSREHSHDLLIYCPELNQYFHTSSDSIIPAE